MAARNSSAQTSPRIDALSLGTLEPGDVAELVPGADLDGLAFARLDGAVDLTSVTLLESELAESNVDRLELRGARLLSSRVSRVTAPIVSGRRSTWRDVEVLGSRLGAVDVTDAEVRRLVIEDSKLGWLNLRSSKAQDMLFRNCTFDEIDFSSAILARVAFEGCSADKLTLTHVRAEHLDLRGLDFRALDGIEGLKGSLITHDQLAYLSGAFAHHFGITVRD